MLKSFTNFVNAVKVFVADNVTIPLVILLFFVIVLAFIGVNR